MSQIKEAIEEIRQMIEWAKSPKEVEEHGNKAIDILHLLAEVPNAGELSKEIQQAFTDIIGHKRKWEDTDTRLLILAKVRIDRQAANLEKLKEGGYIRHKHTCNMGEYNSILTGKGCTCGLSGVLKEKQDGK